MSYIQLPDGSMGTRDDNTGEIRNYYNQIVVEGGSNDWAVPTFQGNPTIPPGIEGALDTIYAQVTTEGTTETRNMSNLSIEQSRFAALYKKNKDLVKGTPVNYGGSHGTIVKTLNDGDNIEQVLFQILLPDDHMINSNIWNFIPRTQITDKVLGKRAVAKLQRTAEEKALDSLATSFTYRQNNKLQSLRSSITQNEQSIAQYQQSIIKLEKSIESAHTDLKTYEKAVLSPADVIKILAELGKNKKVDEVYIRDDGSLVIITTNLRKIKGGKEDAGELGHFGFNIRFNDCSIRACNLNYTAHGYFHPNINGTAICWGENGSEVYKMIDERQLLPLMDLLLDFFSLWPQDEGGSPYITCGDWWASRSKVTFLNPSAKRLISDVLGKKMAEVIKKGKVLETWQKGVKEKNV